MLGISAPPPTFKCQSPSPITSQHNNIKGDSYLRRGDCPEHPSEKIQQNGTEHSCADEMDRPKRGMKRHARRDATV